MKQTYITPEIEATETELITLLVGSGGDHDSNKTGEGSNASDVDNPLPGGGTRAKGWNDFEDFEDNEWSLDDWGEM